MSDTPTTPEALHDRLIGCSCTSRYNDRQSCPALVMMREYTERIVAEKNAHLWLLSRRLREVADAAEPDHE